MPLSRVHLDPTQKHSSYTIIGISKIIINMPLGLVMQGSISKTLEQPTMLCMEQDIDFVIQEPFSFFTVAKSLGLYKTTFSTFSTHISWIKRMREKNETVCL